VQKQYQISIGREFRKNFISTKLRLCGDPLKKWTNTKSELCESKIYSTFRPILTMVKGISAVKFES